MNSPKRKWTETSFSSANGYVVGLILFILAAAIGFTLITGGYISPRHVGISAICGTLLAILAGGFYMLQPNEGAIVTLFGDYRGTDRSSGLRWRIPFYSVKKISLRSRN